MLLPFLILHGGVGSGAILIAMRKAWLSLLWFGVPVALVVNLAAVNFRWSGQATHAALLIAGMLIVIVVLLQFDHESPTQGR